MKIATDNEIKALLAVQKYNGYKIFERPYELNIIGVRTDSITPNSFDDTINVLWKDDKGKWNGKIYPATTDPGTYWLKNPMSPQGTAAVKQGQHIDVWSIGIHAKQYTALVQTGKITVVRDYDRDAIFDFMNGKDDTGYFGINLHRANSTGVTVTVDKNSAGCQVLANAKDFDDLMLMAQKHKGLYGNKFSYTLTDRRMFNRMLKRRGTYIATALIVIGVIALIYRKQIELKTKNININI